MVVQNVAIYNQVESEACVLLINDNHPHVQL